MCIVAYSPGERRRMTSVGSQMQNKTLAKSEPGPVAVLNEWIDVE